MGRVQKRSRRHHGVRDVARSMRTRSSASKLDMDQIQGNLNDPKKKQALLEPAEADIDKPGLGKFYCVECDRHFDGEEARERHRRSKLHKRRVKKLQEPAYTQEEADKAAGLSGTDTRQRGPGASTSVTSGAVEMTGIEQ